MTPPSELLKGRWLLRLLILKRNIWTPEEGEKEIMKICWSMQGIEPGSSEWNAKVLTTIQTLVLEEVDCNKVSYIIKAPISTTLYYPRLRCSILGIKAYLLLYKDLSPPCWKIPVLKYSSANHNVPVPEWCQNEETKCLCRNVSCLNARCWNDPKPVSDTIHRTCKSELLKLTIQN